MSHRAWRVALMLLAGLSIVTSGTARAQPVQPSAAQIVLVQQDPSTDPPQDAQATKPKAAKKTKADEEEAELQPAEPEFSLVNLPTTLQLPVHRGNFRFTHRFGRNLRQGSFRANASDLFGLDNGAVIGLEFRFGIFRHVEAGIHRSSLDKATEFFGKYDAWHQNQSMPVSMSGLIAIEGDNNFHKHRQPALGAVLSRTINDSAALYVSPVWVHNSNPDERASNNNTFFLGLGGRLRFRPTVYLVAEVSPRVSGFDPGKPLFAFGVEKRVGGHLFQLNFSNSFGTTFGQIARGGIPGTLRLGFNIARKLF